MNSSSRRGFLATAAGAAAALSVVGHRSGFAQQFPARGILVIVPYAAGGGSDVSARLLARDLEPILGKPVTVENRAGGGGWIGWGALAGVEARRLHHRLHQRAEHVRRLSGQAAGRRAQGEPGELHAADQSRRRSQSLGGAARQQVQDRQGRHRRGQAPPGNDHAQRRRPWHRRSRRGAGHRRQQPERASRWCIFAARRKARPRCWPATSKCSPANVSEVAEDVKAGQFRILGVMSAERSPFIPNGPTFREQGFNEVWSVSRGIAAPAGLPKDVETALIGYLEKTISSKEHKAKAETAGARPADHQGRRLPQVPQGQRAEHQEADELVTASGAVVPENYSLMFAALITCAHFSCSAFM